MFKFFNLFFFFVIFNFFLVGSVNGQLTTFDAQNNFFNVISRIVEKADLVATEYGNTIQAGTNILTKAMSNDIIGVLEQLETQTELINLSDSMRRTIGGVIQGYRDYQEFQNTKQKTNRRIKEFRKRVEQLSDNDKFDIEFLEDLSNTVSAIQDITHYSNSLFGQAVDPNDRLSDLERLKAINEASEKHKKIQSTVDNLDAQLDDLIKKEEEEEVLKDELFAFSVSPGGKKSNPGQSLVSINKSDQKRIINTLKTKKRRTEGVRKERAGNLLDILFFYGNFVIGIVVLFCVFRIFMVEEVDAFFTMSMVFWILLIYNSAQVFSYVLIT